MRAKFDKPKREISPCSWCSAEVFKVGVCLIGGTPLGTCNAWRCDTGDTYLDCLGMPTGFERIMFDIPSVQHCRFIKE